MHSRPGRLLALLTTLCLWSAPHVSAQTLMIDPARIPGIVVDDEKAALTGTWKNSTSTKPYVGQGYIHATGEGNEARFEFDVPESGNYHVFAAYSSGPNRSAKAPVHVEAADGRHTVYVNQKNRAAGPYHFQSLGEFEFELGTKGAVIVAGSDDTGVVIADAIAVLTPDELQEALEAAKKAGFAAKPPAAVVNKSTAPENAAPEQPQAPTFVKHAPPRPLNRLTPDKIDALLAEKIGPVADKDLIDDTTFLRRVSLDIVGRQPTPAELSAFLAETSPNKRADAIDRLLASPDYGANWANYWSDVMGYRMQEPELTFHDYRTIKHWLADELNAGKTWDEIVYQMITAVGTVGENPAATFVAFHQGDNKKLAGETSRVFLGMQISCAECHDHPFVDMPQTTFHGMAAFFVRVQAKIPWNDSDAINVSSKATGEHTIPEKKSIGQMKPTDLQGESYELGMEDVQRRAVLGQWITSPDNPFFARAYVNRIWSRLMGRGFCEPVDDLGELADVVLPDLHASLAEHFVATGYDTKDVVRLVTNTRFYQRAIAPVDQQPDKPFFAAVAKKLRGDEVFDSLATAIALPDVRPQQAKADGAFRFPPPPKSTRDLVNDAFGYDPSFKDDQLTRTMKQAMFLMNNVQIQAQINAAPESGTMLARLLAEQADNDKAVVRLYEVVLARQPTAREQEIALAHIARVKERGPAFEDLLWSLINSAEFTTRK